MSDLYVEKLNIPESEIEADVKIETDVKIEAAVTEAEVATDEEVRDVPIFDWKAFDKKNRIEKLTKRGLLICSILLVGELVWIFIVNPSMPFSIIEVTGAQWIDRNAILNQAGISVRSSYFSFNVVTAEQALSLIPQVESVEVDKVFPDTLKIILHERKPVAVSLAIVNGRTDTLVFDKNGVVFEMGSGGIAIPSNLPIISGMVFENIRLGMRLPHFLLPLLEDIYELGQKSSELLSVISEIHINKKAFDSFDLVVYPTYRQVKIKMGPELKAANLSNMLLLLDVFNERGIEKKEIDFRTGTASYKVD
jgi:cell division protein FtsQ